MQADIAQRADNAGTWANRAGGNTHPRPTGLSSAAKAGNPENRLIARVGRDLRNGADRGQTQRRGAVVHHRHWAQVAAMLRFHRLPYFDMLANVGRQFDSEQRAISGAWRHRRIADQHAQPLDRRPPHAQPVGPRGRLGDEVVARERMDDGLRGAFAATMMQGFAKTGQGLGRTGEWDRHLMERKGISEADWAIISSAAPTERQRPVPDGRRHQDHGRRWRSAGATASGAPSCPGQAQFAVMNPTWPRAPSSRPAAACWHRVRGEAMRSLMQFKSFPLAMLYVGTGGACLRPQDPGGRPGLRRRARPGAAVNRAAVLAALNVADGHWRHRAAEQGGDELRTRMT